MATIIPLIVVATDHNLEQASDQATEALAEHRWHQTLDPDGPQHSLRSYAKAVSRNVMTIRKYAQGYADWVYTTGIHSLADCLVLANLSAEKAEVAEAVAAVEGKSLDTVSKRRGSTDSLANITEQARDRADRTGTTLGQAATDIATTARNSRLAEQEREADRADRHGLRYLAIEGHLANAKRRLTEALTEAHSVSFDPEELEMIADSIDNIRTLLGLLDLKFAGSVDVDWDGELAKLGQS